MQQVYMFITSTKNVVSKKIVLYQL